MFKEIFRFELRQQLKTPLFWIFLVLFFVGGAALTSSPAVMVGSAVGNVHVNAPVVVAILSAGIALLATLFIVVFVARALLRDFDQGTAETVFSTPVTRGAYLGGRFTAGFAIALAVTTAALLGMLVGTLMPWIDAARLGPMSILPWAWSFGVIIVPDMLFVAALLFALAAATRSLLAVFVGVIALIVLRSVATALMSGLGTHVAAGLLDPYGQQALAATIRYWTAHAYNTQLPPFTGVLLGNRVLWLAVAAALFVVGFGLFRADREGLRLRLRRPRKVRGRSAIPVTLALPLVATRHDWHARWRQFVSLARMDTAGILRSVLFPVMLVLGLAILTAILLMSGKIYGTPVYPVTHVMITDIRGSMSLFLLIVLGFYAGELVWRNRSLRTGEMTDALPVPAWTSLAAQAMTLAIITVIFLVVGALFTIAFQLFNGYSHLQVSLYAGALALDAIGFVLIGILALVLQVLVNSKYFGYLLFVVFLVAALVVPLLGFTDNLYLYAGGPSVPYSDLNGFGHFLPGALWFDLYWALVALALLVIAALFQARGTDRGRRWRTAASRVCRWPLATTLVVALIGIGASGTWVYYNTHILNTYTSRDDGKQQLADYEKLYSRYANAPQPRITAVDSRVDIHPYQRTLHTRVSYTLTNKHAKPIDTLYVNWDPSLPPTRIEFPAHTTVKRDTRLGFSIYKLTQALAPGASMTWTFDVDYAPHGFKNNVDLSGMDAKLVHNGTFLTNGALFPSFGYNRRLELTDKSDRRKYGLKPVNVPRMPPLSEDPARRANNYISMDSDWIAFNTVISTALDQTAIAPGALVKTWTAGGRRYFHYQTHAPMLNFFAYLSGRWKVKRAQWNDVAISVYYNPAHAWNVDDMIASAKDALSYYTGHYGPYQFKYLRIIEFPGYIAYAQSFAGTIPFSESIGFIADLKNKSDINYPYYVTAHEVAHQWWAHQVIGAYMQGSTMLSESLAQYSALMVMKQHYGANKMRKFLKYELDTYLAHRVTDRGGETALGKVEGQAYIRYNKASVIFYALQDYIGEGVIDGVLHNFVDTFGFKGPPYPTSMDLVRAIKSAAGSQWNQLIDDSFWKITLYDNRVVSADAKRLADGAYQVTMKVHAAKFYASAKGKQTSAKMDLPVDIGVFAKAPDGIEGDEPVLYLVKRNVADGDSTITLTVSGKPYEVGIDPYNELVDRNSGDNRQRVTIQ